MGGADAKKIELGERRALLKYAAVLYGRLWTPTVTINLVGQVDALPTPSLHILLSAWLPLPSYAFDSTYTCANTLSLLLCVCCHPLWPPPWYKSVDNRKTFTALSVHSFSGSLSLFLALGTKMMSPWTCVSVDLVYTALWVQRRLLLSVLSCGHITMAMYELSTLDICFFISTLRKNVFNNIPFFYTSWAEKWKIVPKRRGRGVGKD